MTLDGYVILEQTKRCQRLAYSTLHQVILDIRGEGSARGETEQARERIKQDAIDFIFDNHNNIYGFLWLCQTLDLNPLKIRNAVLDGTLLHMKQESFPGDGDNSGAHYRYFAVGVLYANERRRGDIRSNRDGASGSGGLDNRREEAPNSNDTESGRGSNEGERSPTCQGLDIL